MQTRISFEANQLCLFQSDNSVFQEFLPTQKVVYHVHSDFISPGYHPHILGLLRLHQRPVRRIQNQSRTGIPRCQSLRLGFRPRPGLLGTSIRALWTPRLIHNDARHRCCIRGRFSWSQLDRVSLGFSIPRRDFRGFTHDELWCCDRRSVSSVRARYCHVYFFGSSFYGNDQTAPFLMT